jgi:hypothetical protein
LYSTCPSRFSPETVGPLTFPYDPLYIFPALRPPPPRKGLKRYPFARSGVDGQKIRSRSHNSESLLRYYFFHGFMSRLLYSLSSDLRSAASQALSPKPTRRTFGPHSLPAARYNWPRRSSPPLPRSLSPVSTDFPASSGSVSIPVLPLYSV